MKKWIKLIKFLTKTHFLISRDFLPSQNLSDYISHYRLRHFIFNDLSQSTFKPFPPRPEQCIVFYPRGYEISENVNSGEKILRERSVFCGQFTERINRFVSSPEFLMISVDLKPGALYRLTGIPFRQFTNKSIDAESIFPSQLPQVNSRLSGAEDYYEMIQIIEQFFFDLVAASKKESIALDPLLQNITKDSSGLKLDDLVRQAYLSPRQLERKFEERVGIGPKTFLRISRFNQSYWMRLKNPMLDLFTIAINCGYNDYQHMSKEYKEFANSTPNKFFAEEEMAPGRKLGLTK